MGVRSLNEVLSGFFFSLLPVVKKHWDRALKENPKYTAFEGEYTVIILRMIVSGYCRNEAYTFLSQIKCQSGKNSLTNQELNLGPSAY